MNLFNVTRSIEHPLGTKPRTANDDEVRSYMRWQRERLGLVGFEQVELHFTEDRSDRRYERGHCIGATFGQQTCGARWPVPAQYENGAYSIIMPGHDAHRQTITLERLDDAGEVVASQTMPREPKKGGVIWSREDVRAACGQMPKAAKARRGKVAPIPVQADMPEIPASEVQESVFAPYPHSDGPEPVEALSGPEIAPDEPLSIAQELPAEPVSNPDELPGDPVAALLARVEALEAALAALPAVSALSTFAASNEDGKMNTLPTVERAKRSPAHERAIRRAWAERKARREAQSGERAAWFQANLMRDTAANNNRCAQHHIAVAERLREKRRRAVLSARASLSRLRADLAETVASNAEWEALQHRTWTEAMGHKAKRRRAVHRAIGLRRAAGIERARAETLAAQLAKAKHDLDIQGRAATYFDAGTGMEMADRTGRAVHEARRATERADALQARLDNAMAGNAAMQAGIDRMEGELVAAVIRARKAETALAAVQARANGWPPAVRSVSVRFDAKAA